MWTHFGAQKRSKRSPKRSPRAAKTRSQSKTLPNQKLAFRLGGSSLFGSWSGPRRGPAEAKDAILQAKNLQKRGSKSAPKKVTKNDDEGTKKRPKMEPKNRSETDPKMDPNIISLRIGSLRLSGVGARPCRRKREGNRKGKGGLEYVQERKGEDIYIGGMKLFWRF